MLWRKSEEMLFVVSCTRFVYQNTLDISEMLFILCIHAVFNKLKDVYINTAVI